MNRNIILVVAFFLFIPIKSNPQIIESYGLKIGYVNSGQTSSNGLLRNVLKRKSGFSISSFMDLLNISGFFISPEIKYIQKGSRMEYIFTSAEGSHPIGKTTKHVYNNYLSIPISFGYKKQFAIGNSFIKLAPRYDILLKSYDDFNSPLYTDIISPLPDYKDHKNVFGGTISLGFIPKLNVGFSPFFELSYHMDFTYTYPGDYNKIKNNAIEVNLGLYL